MASVHESDEDMARRIQQEELAGSNQFQRSSDDNGPLEAATVQDNAIIALNNTRSSSPRLLKFNLTYLLIELIICVVCIGVSYGKHLKCDQPIEIWIFSRIAYCFFMSIHRIRRIMGIPEGIIEQKGLTWLKLCMFIMFIFGQSIVFDSNTCNRTNPFLYYWSLTLVIIFYISLLLPLILLIGICLCLPCVLIVLRLLTPNPGASTELIDELPEFKFDPNTFGLSAEELESGVTINKDDDPPSCAICIEEYNKDELIKRLRCDHTFHSECIDRWLRVRDSCPMCRADIHGEHEQPNAEDSGAPLARLLMG